MKLEFQFQEGNPFKGGIEEPKTALDKKNLIAWKICGLSALEWPKHVHTTQTTGFEGEYSQVTMTWRYIVINGIETSECIP